MTFPINQLPSLVPFIIGIVVASDMLLSLLPVGLDIIASHQCAEMVDIEVGQFTTSVEDGQLLMFKGQIGQRSILVLLEVSFGHRIHFNVEECPSVQAAMVVVCSFEEFGWKLS